MNPLNSENPEVKPHKIAIATGTRADWGLLLPLARELQSRGESPVIVATNAHFFPELGMTVDEITDDGFTPVRIPVRRNPDEATADALTGFARFLREERPGCLVMLGDRYEMLGAASAALLEGVPVVHIAGGNVTLGAFDNAIRAAISDMAALHLPETARCADNLRRHLPAGARIVCAGSPGVYNALNTPLMGLAELENSLGFTLGSDFLLVTLHAATVDDVPPVRRYADFLAALRAHLDANPARKVIITYPNSDVNPAPLITLIGEFAASMPGRVLAVPSLGRVRYLSAAALCKAVVGNSSSGIEETPSLGVPTLDIGSRQKGRERGAAVFHCEADYDSIVKGLEQVTSSEAESMAAKADNPYYRPGTPSVQADAILNFIAPGRRYLYLIPARGGSKGIPGKNIRPFGGKPLIAYAIEQGLGLAADPADVVVSTDSEEIAAVARKYGANVPFMRPDYLAADNSGSREVIVHALDFMRDAGRDYDAVVLLQPTSPFRSVDDITAAVGIYEKEDDADMVVSVTEAEDNPYYNAFEADGRGCLHLSKGDGVAVRRQDAPKVWRYTGAVYVINPDSIRRLPMARFPRIIPSPMPSDRAVDLDTPRDWAVAEFLKNYRND